MTTGTKHDVPITAKHPIVGIVRNKSGWGVCVKRSNYDEVYTALHPGKTVPAEFVAKRTWRATPIPVGVTQDAVTEWASNLGWAVKVSKFLGANTAILLSKEPPPVGILAINGNPILITELRNRRSAARTVVAGTISRTPTPQVNQGQDVLQVHDPCAKASASGAVNQTATRAPAVPQGPVEQQLKQHEAELNSLQELSNKQDKMQTDVITHAAQIKDEVLQFVQKTAAKQEQKTQCCFLELKQLLVSHTQDRKDGTRPAKKSKADTNMDEDIL